MKIIKLPEKGEFFVRANTLTVRAAVAAGFFATLVIR